MAQYLLAYQNSGLPDRRYAIDIMLKTLESPISQRALSPTALHARTSHDKNPKSEYFAPPGKAFLATHCTDVFWCLS